MVAKHGSGYSQIIYGLDENGVVMAPPDPAWLLVPALNFNQIMTTLVGVPFKDLNAGHLVESPQVQAAIRLCCFESGPILHGGNGRAVKH